MTGSPSKANYDLESSIEIETMSEEFLSYVETFSYCNYLSFICGRSMLWHCRYSSGLSKYENIWFINSNEILKL